MRALRGTTGIDRAIEGLTFLASATPGGGPGNGDSYDVTFSNNSDAVTFTSAASNLSGSDANGQPDVHQRTMERAYGPKFRGRKVQYLRMATRLISATPSGEAGNGASYAPAGNTTGSVVAFTTTASNLIGRGSPHPQVVQAEVGPGGIGTRLASRGAGGGGGNGPSGGASVSAGGEWVVFESAASDVATTTNRGPDTNGTADAMLFTASTGERWLLGQSSGRAPTSNPMTSPHGNYVVFERGGQIHLLYVGAK